MNKSIIGDILIPIGVIIIDIALIKMGASSSNMMIKTLTFSLMVILTGCMYVWLKRPVK